MRIEECSFGQVTIDAVTYTRDVILYRDRVEENWWRKQGHALVKEDLPRIFEEKPDVFVMGMGHSKAVRVPDETRQAFAEAGIRLVELDTPAACRELNRLFAEGVDAAGGLHLTC